MTTKILAALLLLGAPLAAQTPAPQPPPVRPPYGTPVTLAQAKTLVSAAEAEARKNGWRMAIVVVEPTGSLVLFEKLDDTQYGSIEIAQLKARAAATLRRRTKETADQVAGGSLNSLSIPGAIAADGGIPIVIDGKIVGAVGVSGGSSDQDAQVGLAGLAALK